MAFITTGLTKNAQGKEGVTAHYNFSYDSSFAGPGGLEPARTNAVIAARENDYNLMSEWFGGGITITGIDVQVTTPTNQFCGPPPSGGACWSSGPSSLTVQLIAQGNDPIYLRYLLILEVTEIFMQRQNAGWFQGSNEGSKGEGLSRFLGTQFWHIRCGTSPGGGGSQWLCSSHSRSLMRTSPSHSTRHLRHRQR